MAAGSKCSAREPGVIAGKLRVTVEKRATEIRVRGERAIRRSCSARWKRRRARASQEPIAVRHGRMPRPRQLCPTSVSWEVTEEHASNGNSFHYETLRWGERRLVKQSYAEAGSPGEEMPPEPTRCRA